MAWGVACSDIWLRAVLARAFWTVKLPWVWRASCEVRVVSRESRVVSCLGLFFLVCGPIYLTGQYLHEAM